MIHVMNAQDMKAGTYCTLHVPGEYEKKRVALCKKQGHILKKYLFSFFIPVSIKVLDSRPSVGFSTFRSQCSGDVIAIGDGENDVEFLSVAGKAAIAMKNAHGAAKRLRRLLRRTLNIPLVVIQLAQCTRLCQDQAALRP